MFGDLFGNLEGQQKALREELKKKKIVVSEAQGRITIEANAAREVLNVRIDDSLLSPDKREELEDHLIIALNTLMVKASEAETSQMQDKLQSMMPGFGDLLKGFKP